MEFADYISTPTKRVNNSQITYQGLNSEYVHKISPNFNQRRLLEQIHSFIVKCWFFFLPGSFSCRLFFPKKGKSLETVRSFTAGVFPTRATISLWERKVGYKCIENNSINYSVSHKNCVFFPYKDSFQEHLEKRVTPITFTSSVFFD